MNDEKTVRIDSIGEEYTVRTHRSGLTVFTIPKKRSEIYAVLTVRFGADDCRFRPEKGKPVIELPDGVAHFLEHKMFEEEDGTDSFALYAQTGAFANAFTTRDCTSYLFSCTEGFEENLRILLCSVTHPYFTEQTIAKEQGIISEEIDMHKTPSETVHNNLMKCLYHVHPVRNDICGSRESIAKITPELLYACTDAFYVPSNMSLIIAGNIDPVSVMRICDEVLPEEKVPMKAVREPLPEPESVACPSIEELSEISQPMILIGFKAPVRNDPEEDMRVTAANMVNMELLFGRSGLFFNRLYEEGIINDGFDADYTSGFGYAHTAVYSVCDDPEILLKEVMKEIDVRRKEYFTKEDFEIAKRVIYANGIIPLDSVEESALTCSDFWVHGQDYLRWHETVSGLRYEDAKRVLNETLRPENVAVSRLYPLQHPVS